jgi:DNA-damage-inducible protein J
MATKPHARSTTKRPAKTAARPPAGRKTAVRKAAVRKPAPRKPAKSGFINARIEPKLKKSAEAVLDKIGLSTTEAVTIFLKQVVAQRGIPFELKIPNRETVRAMRDVEEGRTESFSGTAEELFAHILGKKRR